MRQFLLFLFLFAPLLCPAAVTKRVFMPGTYQTAGVGTTVSDTVHTVPNGGISVNITSTCQCESADVWVSVVGWSQYPTYFTFSNLTVSVGAVGGFLDLSQTGKATSLGAGNFVNLSPTVTDANPLVQVIIVRRDFR